MISLSQTASRLGRTNRMRSVAEREPMEMVLHIWRMDPSTEGEMPMTPVTRMMISPDVRIVWVAPL